MSAFGNALAAFQEAAGNVSKGFHGAAVFDGLNATAKQAGGLMGSFSGFCSRGRSEADAQVATLKKLFPKGLAGLDEEMRNFEREVGWNGRTGRFAPVRGSSRVSSGGTGRVPPPVAGRPTAPVSPRPGSVSPVPSRPAPVLIAVRSPAPDPASSPSTSVASVGGTPTHPKPVAPVVRLSLPSSPSGLHPSPPAAVSHPLARKYAEGWSAYRKMYAELIELGKFEALRVQIGASLDEVTRITAELEGLSSKRIDLGNASGKKRELAAMEKALQRQKQFAEEFLGYFPDRDAWMATVENNLKAVQKGLDDAVNGLGSRPDWAEDRRRTIEGCLQRYARISSARKALATRLRKQKSESERVARAVDSAIGNLSAAVSAESARAARFSSLKSRGEALCRNAESAYRSTNPKTSLRFSLGQAGGRWAAVPPKAAFFRDLETAAAPHAHELATQARRVGELQPTVSALTPADINDTDVFPAYVVVDSCEVPVAGHRIEIPVPTVFPFRKPRYFRDASEIGPFLLRLVCALPVGSVRITMLDIEKKGDNGRLFNGLAKAGPDVFRLVTDIDDLNGVLKEHGSYIASLASTGKFTATVGDWAAYNACHPGNPLPVRILVVHSVHGWDEGDVDDLTVLLDGGPKAGVFVFFSLDGKETLPDRALEKVETWPANATTTPVDIAKWAKEGRSLNPARIPKHLPTPVQVERILDAYADLCAKRSARAAHVFADLFAGTPVWSASTAEGLETVMGWDEAGDPVVLRLGGNKIHALIGGETGGGKSNLIHVVLCSLCHKYSPEELQIFLLDMKDGVEAFRYVDESTGKAWLPHAKAILASDSPHFAATFLADVIAEMHARNAIFRRDGAANIAEWRHKTKQKMPRILVVADEFTRMFADSDSAKATSSKLFDLLSLGRNAGVHVILATQDTNALTTANASVILSQTSLRLALPNAPGVLASGNNDDDTLSKPQCILNEFSGAAGKNRVFVHPFFDNKKIPGDALLFRKAVAAALPSLRGAVLSACKVVDGVSLETVPAGSEFRHRLGPEPTGTRPRLNLLLGRTDDFATQPFLLQLVGDSYKDHLLVAAPKDPEERPGVWSGLRFSVLQSLAFLSSKRVVFYNPLLETPFKLPAGFEVLGNDIDEAGLRTRLEALRSSKERHKVLVVENFEHAEFLASESSSPFGSTDDGEDTAAGVFRLAFKRGAKAFTTILFTRDPVGAESMLGMSGWDVVAHRIAFGFETASALRSVIKGTDMLDNPGRSVFYSSPSTGGGFRTILPFVKPEKGSGTK